jgi:hypothetical protein
MRVGRPRYPPAVGPLDANYTTARNPLALRSGRTVRRSFGRRSMEISKPLTRENVSQVYGRSQWARESHRRHALLYRSMKEGSGPPCPCESGGHRSSGFGIAV